jgi:hypothetical protein
MRSFLLNSTAAFSPPDNGGSAVIDNTDSGNVGENISGEGGSVESADVAPAADATPAAGAAPAAQEDHSKPRVETISDSIKRAVNETKEKADAAAKSAAKKPAKADAAGGAAKPADPAKASSETKVEGDAAAAPQAGPGAPDTWKKEEKAIWDSLPDLAKQAITRREADATKGVQELKTRYQDIDTAVAPYKAVMTQNNVTPAQAISQLFKWHMELAGPNKVQAYVQLGKNFGIDPATVAAALATQTEVKQPAAPDNSIPDNLRPVITDLETRIKSFEEQNALAAQNAAKQTWMNWAKDKPHAEKVRGLMANLINSDLALIQAGQPQVSNTIHDGSIDMDAAYQAAVYAHPEVRQTLLQEERATREKEAKAAAEKARKASASMRSGAPAGAVAPASSAAPKNESVADSIRRALAEVRGTQH